MTDLPKSERDERLARLAARGRVARPAPTASDTAAPARARAPRPAPAPARAKHAAGGSRLFTGIMSAAVALGIISGLAFGGHQVATAQAATPTQTVVVPTSGTTGSSGSTTRSAAAAPAPTAIATPSTTSGGS